MRVANLNGIRYGFTKEGYLFMFTDTVHPHVIYNVRGLKAFWRGLAVSNSKRLSE